MFVFFLNFYIPKQQLTNACHMNATTPLKKVTAGERQNMSGEYDEKKKKWKLKINALPNLWSSVRSELSARPSWLLAWFSSPAGILIIRLILVQCKSILTVHWTLTCRAFYQKVLGFFLLLFFLWTSSVIWTFKGHIDVTSKFQQAYHALSFPDGDFIALTQWKTNR